MNNELAIRHGMLPSPLGSFEAYLAAVQSIPVLAADEEHRLALRLRDEHDLDAARTLVLSHLRFVAHIARGYLGYGLPLPDLVQEGNIGLMKAVRRFDPEVGVRLVSFAVHWIRAEIHEFVLRNWRIVKVATTKAQRKLFFHLRSAARRLSWLSADEAEAVAKDLGVPTEEVYRMEERLTGQDIAFDPYPDEDDSPGFAPAAYLPDHRLDPAHLLEAADSDRHEEARLQDALAALDARSRAILERRWLAETKATLHELAAEYGVSAERIRQIEAASLAKLKRAIVPA